VTLTECGALIGTATGLFVLWDRVISGRPVVSIVTRGEDLRDLELMNPSKCDLFIREIKIWGKANAFVARGPSPGSIADAEAATKVGNVVQIRKLIAPGAKLALPVMIQSSSVPQKISGRPFLFIIRWRKTSSMWLPQPAKFMLSSVRALTDIDAAK
jgi:hypothetical protein